MPMLHRFKDAAIGLGITLVPIAALACVHLLPVPYTLATVHNVSLSAEPMMVPYARGAFLRDYAVILLIVAAYWLLAATLCTGRFLRIRSANIVLALAVLVFAFSVIASIVMRPVRLFEGLCPLLGLSDDVAGFGFDIRSPCEDFAWQATPIMLLGVPLLLFVTSAALRIIVSRRRHGGGDG